jgi:hypothetical protein
MPPLAERGAWSCSEIAQPVRGLLCIFRALRSAGYNYGRASTGLRRAASSREAKAEMVFASKRLNEKQPPLALTVSSAYPPIPSLLAVVQRVRPAAAVMPGGP